MILSMLIYLTLVWVGDHSKRNLNINMYISINLRKHTDLSMS